jgi:acyl-CoA reductase-like NAD-dependent aldehyde dehydrogenase
VHALVCHAHAFPLPQIYEKFSQALAGAFQNGAVVGDPLKEGVLIGPINNKMQHKKVSEFCEYAACSSLCAWR